MRLTGRKLLLLIIAVTTYIFLTVHIFQDFIHTKRVPKRARPPKKLLILVSQPRSGSSYLGRVFSKSLQSIYFYEPLYQLYNYWYGQGNFTGPNLNFERYDTTAEAYLRSVFKCNFRERNIWRPILTSKLKELSSFLRNYECNTRERKPPLTIKGKRGHTFNRCMPYFNPFALEQDCQKLNLMVKLLEPRLPRTNLLNLKHLVEGETSYQVIYLVRDPRASFSSLLKQGWITESFDDNFKAYIQLRCDEMLRNIQEIAKKKHFIVVRYEDLMTKPKQVLQPLKRFLDEQVMQRIIKTLKDNLCYVPMFNNVSNLTETKDNVRIRKRSTDNENDDGDGDDIDQLQETMEDDKGDNDNDENIHNLPENRKQNYECYSINKWRLTAKEDFVKTVEDSCSGVMKVMGYVVAKNFDEIKNRKHSLVQKFDLNGL